MSTPSPVRSRRRGPPTLAAILLLAAVVLGAGLGLRDPAPPDEPRFVLVARTMVETGDWLLPRRGIELYSHKPPVFMWLQATAFLATGDWQVAFLLPSLLAGLATLWLTWDLARRLWGPRLRGARVAACAAFALLSTVQFGLLARRGQIDMVLTAFTTLALWALVRHLLLSRDGRLATLAGFAAGLGTVTKGVGFLPLLVLIPWRLLPDTARGPARGNSSMMWATVLVGFVVGTAAWLGPLFWQLLHDGDPALRAYASDLLLRQTAGRYANPWHHLRPPWYYLQVILTLWLPGALLLPWLVPAWFRRLRRRERRQWLLLGWGLLVLLFFTVSPGKREVYLLPALPAFCLAAAPLLPGLLRRRDVRWVLFGYLILVSAASALLGAAGLIDAAGLASRLSTTRGLAPAEVTTLFAWLVVAGIGGLALAAWRRPRRAGGAVVMFMALLWAVHGHGLAPTLDASSSARALMQGVGDRIGPDAGLALLDWREQQMLQADRPVVDFGFSRPVHAQWSDAYRWLAAAPSQRWLLAPGDDLTPCVTTAQTVAAGRANRVDWVLVPGTALRSGCTPH